MLRDLALVVLLSSATALLAQNDRSDRPLIADGGLGAANVSTLLTAGYPGSSSQSCIAGMADYDSCVALRRQAGQSVFVENPGQSRGLEDVPKSGLEQLYDGLMLFQDLTATLIDPRPVVYVVGYVRAPVLYQGFAVDASLRQPAVATSQSGLAVFRSKSPSGTSSGAHAPSIGAPPNGTPTTASAGSLQLTPNGQSTFRRKSAAADAVIHSGSTPVSAAAVSAAGTAVFRRTADTRPVEPSVNAVPREPGTAAFKRTEAATTVGRTAPFPSGSNSAAHPTTTARAGQTNGSGKNALYRAPTAAPTKSVPQPAPKTVVVRVPPPVIYHK